MSLTPEFGPGTPEYDAYVLALRAELALFVARVPPYDTDDLTTIGFAPVDGRKAGFGK